MHESYADKGRKYRLLRNVWLMLSVGLFTLPFTWRAFFRETWRRASPFAKRCVHCGLVKYSSS